jgi:tetrachloro-p-hydroquinone reductive dehalogenase
MADVTLYNVPPSLCSQKVRLALVEKGVDFENYWVDIGPTSENYQPWYVRLNPKCVVPTLTHGENVVTDSACIMRYVDTTFPGTPLIPVDPEKNAETIRWFELGDSLDFRLFTFSSVPTVISNGMLRKKLKTLKKYAAKYPDLRTEYEAKIVDIQGLMDAKDDEIITTQHRQKIEEALDEMDEILGRQPFLAGDEYTMADVMWTVVLTRMTFLKATAMIEQRPNIHAYYQRMQRRPSFVQADLWSRFKLSAVPKLLGTVLRKTVGLPQLALLGFATLTAMSTVAVMYWT